MSREVRDMRRVLWQAMSQTVTARLQGDCMVPTLYAGDELTIRCETRAIRSGDVAVIDNGTMWLAHRTVAVGLNGLITKPDSTQYFDGPTPWKSVIGVVTKATSPEGVLRNLEYELVGNHSDLSAPVLSALMGFLRVAGDRSLFIDARDPKSAVTVQTLRRGSIPAPVDAIALQGLSYAESPREVFEAVHRSLRDGGLLVLVDELFRLPTYMPEVCSLQPRGFLGDGRDAVAGYSLDRVVYYREQALVVASKHCSS